jgi:hypothetical protein
MNATEGYPMNRTWNAAIHSLVLVRIGQELGTESQASKAVHDLVELLALAASVLGLPTF